jgi:four helix bundle protein
MKGHRDLVVWQKAMILVTEIYRATRDFPREEVYGLTSQLRRAAVSVPSNLAEGHGRNSRKEFHHFIGQARGSLTEVETQLEIVRNLDYLSKNVALELLSKSGEIGRMLNGLRVWSKSSSSSSDLLTPDY